MVGSTERLYAEFGALVVAHRKRLEGMTQAELGASNRAVPDLRDEYRAGTPPCVAA